MLFLSILFVDNPQRCGSGSGFLTEFPHISSPPYIHYWLGHLLIFGCCSFIVRRRTYYSTAKLWWNPQDVNLEYSSTNNFSKQTLKLSQFYFIMLSYCRIQISLECSQLQILWDNTLKDNALMMITFKWSIQLLYASHYIILECIVNFFRTYSIGSWANSLVRP